MTAFNRLFLDMM